MLMCTYPALVSEGGRTHIDNEVNQLAMRADDQVRIINKVYKYLCAHALSVWIAFETWVINSLDLFMRDEWKSKKKDEYMERMKDRTNEMKA